MKRINGTGTVVKLSGKRRRPYVALITVGCIKKVQTRKRLGAYTTMDEALSALLAYNADPYEIDTKKITFKELYERWKNRAVKINQLAPKTLECLDWAFKSKCQSLYNIPYRNIKIHTMQSVIDNLDTGYATKDRVKALFYHLDKIALEYDIINKCNSQLLRKTQKTHKTAEENIKKLFTESEIKQLWENISVPFVDTVLIMIYSGWRIQELLNLRKEDIELDKYGGIMRGGLKTKAGKNRIIPIHKDILPLVKKRLKMDGDYFISTNNNTQIHQNNYRNLIFKKVMGIIKADHRPHDCRHNLETTMHNLGISEVIRDRIMGHESNTTGKSVYTHITTEQLREAIDKIKFYQ